MPTRNSKFFMCLFNIFQGKYLINQFFLKVINRFVFEQLHVNRYFCLFYRLWEELVLPVSFSVHRKNYSSCLPSDITDARPSLGAEVSILRLTSNIFNKQEYPTLQYQIIS